MLLAVVAALAVGACARKQPVYYAMDPNTGQMVRVTVQPQYTQPPVAQPQYVQSDRDLYSPSPASAQQTYSQPPQYEQQTYVQQGKQPDVVQPSTSGQRGLLTQPGQRTGRTIYVPPNEAQQVYVQPPRYVAPQSGPYTAPNDVYAAASNAPYTLDSGDKLRIVVFGQDGITSSYTVDASGNVTMPLIGSVSARGIGTQQLSKIIADRLKKGYVREPHVTVEVETYRPFFILGEVTTPGQYPYVANMTAETAVAIAGGFAPRAFKGSVEVTRTTPGQQFKGNVPLAFPLRPGDTVMVKERWF